VIKYGPELVATYWPEFQSKDSTYFAHKNKIVPKLPTCINDLKDLPEDYKLTVTKKSFLASPIDVLSQYLLLCSLIGLTILSQSEKWWCDGTFKTAPKFYYQHYIIHGKYKNKLALPGMFSFMSGKSYDLYSMMLTQLKESAQAAGLTLAPKIIHCDFEKGAIKAFKMHFPGVKIQGCHFHFTSAIYKKVVEVGLGSLYSGKDAMDSFTTWIRMCMAFPFLMLGDIDDVWEEMKDTRPELNALNNAKLDDFITYFEDTWIKEKCHFDRKDWNIFERYSSRTNNLSETYNHAINGQIISSKSNIYKVLDLTKKQETLTSVKFERVNGDKVKKTTNSQQVKDAKIALLKNQYKNNELEVMDYLLKVSAFVKSYE
jgi:hypothetical protein